MSSKPHSGPGTLLLIPRTIVRPQFLRPYLFEGLGKGPGDQEGSSRVRVSTSTVRVPFIMDVTLGPRGGRRLHTPNVPKGQRTEKNCDV